jgi:hypothetical protein
MMRWEKTIFLFKIILCKWEINDDSYDAGIVKC